MNRLAWIALTGFGVPLAALAVITCVGDDSPIPAAETDASARAETGSTTPGSNLGPIDSGIDPAACAARTVDEAKGVFVYINGTDSPQCGSASAPCRTVKVGIDQAKVLTRSIVYVARGTYVESFDLSPGVNVEGGWDTLTGKWIPACGNETVSAVKLQMPDNANVIATADFTGAATLRYLSFIGKATAAAGESVYGILARTAALTLEAVSVTVGAGGAGAVGTGGGTGGTGGLRCGAGGGGGGAPGTPGAGADGGTFGATGYTAMSGTNGQGNGTAGGNGTCTATCPGIDRTICIQGTPACSAAQGCPNPLAGCGGAPGTGGGGGGGGGSAVALFGWGATIRVSGGAFVAGNGGNGGNGGPGGDGGLGGLGATAQVLCASCQAGNNCATVGNQVLATGGNGGLGGAGGAGGGGAGGSSFGIYADGPDGKLEVLSAPLYQHGTAGASGAPNGAPGVAADKFP